MNKKIYIKKISFLDYLLRITWNIVYFIFFRFSPVYFASYRRFILRLFGAKIDSVVRIYPSVKIWLPSNLEIKRGSVVGPNVILYNQGKIKIERNVIISQNSHLCSGSHNYKFKNPKLPHFASEILIKKESWICADSFIGPGVIVEEESIIGARSVIMKDTIKKGVYLGNPAKLIKKRRYK